MPRPGLRLGEAEIGQLRTEFQRVRARKDLDMVSRIQGLVLVSEGMGERRVAQIVGVGRRTLQDWIFKFRKGGLKGLIKGPYPVRKANLSFEWILGLTQGRACVTSIFIISSVGLCGGILTQFNGCAGKYALSRQRDRQ